MTRTKLGRAGRASQDSVRVVLEFSLVGRKPLSPDLASQGRCEKIGRASLLASRRPSKSLPHEARREPRPPNPAGFELQGGGRVNADFFFSPRCEENEGAPFRNAHLRVASANHRRRERNCRKIFPFLFSASHAVDFDQFKAPQPQRTLTLRCLLPSRLSVEILTEISP